MILKPTTVDDLPSLFQFQTDAEANHMAAFNSANPSDEEAYMKKWSALVVNPNIRMRTIWVNDAIVGSVVHFAIMGETNVSYWLGREYWGKGIASKALQEFVNNAPTRPLFARVAFDNVGSQRVLEKCDFKRIGSERGYANGRQQEIEEFVYKLD